MASKKIQLFQLVQTYFAAMGYCVSPSRAHQQNPFNGRNLYYSFAVAFMIFPFVGFLIFKARSVYEYGITFYTAITLLEGATYYVIMLFEKVNISNLIEKQEKFIENRKMLSLIE